MRRTLIATLALLSLSLAAPAQTGPWTDGELVVRTNPGGGFQNVVYRIDAQSGHGAMLCDVTAFGSIGGAVFDSYRNGVLLVCSLPPDSWALQSLWLFDAAGNATKLGLESQYPSCLAPASGGRIFFQRNLGGPQPIEWLDASNVAHTLMDASGAAPFVQLAHAMIWSPSQNALFIAVGEGLMSSCSGDAKPIVYRVPLSADGTRVGGAVTCSSWDGGGTEHPTNFDELPGGDLLLTFCSSYIAPDKLRRVNVATGGSTTLGNCNPHDIDGAVWSPALGRVVVLNDGTNTLETYTVGDDGTGTTLPTDVPVSGFTSGTGPGNYLFEVKLGGPGCAGLLAPYGAGLAGAGGIVPVLGGSGCPDVGDGFAISIDNVVGAAPGALFIGLTQGSAPFKGGTFLVGSVVLQVGLAVGGTPGAAGDGFLSLPAALFDPVLIGIDLWMQAGFQDAGAVKGVSLTNGLRVQAG